MSDPLDELVTMSRNLADPVGDYVILGEGNTSAGLDDGTFWVKASGTQMSLASRETFVRVRAEPIVAALTETHLQDEAVKRLLREATVQGDRAPSIETFLHALCLGLEGVRFVGHTHPTAAVALLSSQKSRELFAGSMFPDQIVMLGPGYAYVPYADPGLPLAQAVRQSVDEFSRRERQPPRVVLMENHGIIVLGGTAEQVLNVTQMFVKTCRILIGTLAAGGPRFLTRDHVDRIENRPDELARRQGLQ